MITNTTAITTPSPNMYGINAKKPNDVDRFIVVLINEEMGY